MKKLLLFLVLLAINFGGLAIGGWFTGPGVQSDWYANLPQAPWTPPGWVFGAAWTVVMIGFSGFFHQVFIKIAETPMVRPIWIKRLATAWVLNVLWNPLFFTLNWTGVALIELLLLFLSIAFLCKKGPEIVSSRTTFFALSPYIIWLIIALSLNAFSWYQST